MGIFYDSCEVYNRTPDVLEITFDGQALRLAPLAYTMVPKVAIGCGLNQNPIMGSVDPTNPDVTGGKYLIGIKGDSEYPCEALTKDEWETHLGKPCRTDELAAFQETYGHDPKARLVSNNKGKKTTANSSSEAKNSYVGSASFSAKE